MDGEGGGGRQRERERERERERDTHTHTHTHTHRVREVPETMKVYSHSNKQTCTYENTTPFELQTDRQTGRNTKMQGFNQEKATDPPMSSPLRAALMRPEGEQSGSPL